MWVVFEYIMIIVIVLVAFTEFFIPLLTGKPFFGSFKKSKPAISVETPLEEKINQAKQKVAEAKSVQDMVNKNYKSAEQLKEDSDNLFN